VEEDGVATDGDHLVDAVLEPDTGDLQAIRSRGFLRFAVAPDPLMIAYDGENAVGIAIAIGQELEKHLANRPNAGRTPTVVVPTPMPRGEIVERLKGGMSDFATLTVGRAEQADLSLTQPLIRDVNDVPVLSPDLSGIETLDDLARLPIYISESGRYVRDLRELNAEREKQGKPLFDIRLVDGRLDDYDLIEMVEIGLIPATIASDFKARFWQTAYPSIVIREDLKLTEDGFIGWAVRSKNPRLLRALNGFSRKIRKGTLIGNVVLKKYASSAEWIENLNTAKARLKINEVGPVISRYARRYGFEPDLVLAQAYQESRLDQSVRSHVGAIGVMQVMPSTARDPVVDIPDVTGLDDNVHAGVKYLRWLRDTYFDDPEIEPLDQTLLSFAAYNAGPGGVKRARARASEMDLDPNVWFENVEVAIAQAVSREPVVYVRNIFKYYVSHRLLSELEMDAEEPLSEARRVAEITENLPLALRARALEAESTIVRTPSKGARGTEDLLISDSGAILRGPIIETRRQ
jgi:membrane-bound lytic murein transglycosylase MltF